MSDKPLNIFISPPVRERLEALKDSGLFGFSAGEVAERLICEKLREMEGRKTIVIKPPPTEEPPPAHVQFSLDMTLKEVEMSFILAVFEDTGCNQTLTAKRLNIGLRTVTRKLSEGIRNAD